MPPVSIQGFLHDFFMGENASLRHRLAREVVIALAGVAEVFYLYHLYNSSKVAFCQHTPYLGLFIVVTSNLIIDAYWSRNLFLQRLKELAPKRIHPTVEIPNSFEGSNGSSESSPKNSQAPSQKDRRRKSTPVPKLVPLRGKHGILDSLSRRFFPPSRVTSLSIDNPMKRTTTSS